MTAKRTSITYSFTQPYLPVSYNPFYQTVQSAGVEQELALLDRIDQQVKEMLTYPDAHAIINKLNNREA